MKKRTDGITKLIAEADAFEEGRRNYTLLDGRDLVRVSEDMKKKKVAMTIQKTVADLCRDCGLVVTTVGSGYKIREGGTAE